MLRINKKLFKKQLPIFIGVFLALIICFVGISFLIDKSYKAEDLTNEDIEFLFISGKKHFKLDEKFTFKFKYQPKDTVRKMTASVVNLFGDKYKDMKIKAVVLDLKGNIVRELNPQIIYLGDGEFGIDLDELKYNHMFKPGKYILRFEVENKGKIFVQNEDFTLGVLSINTNKSIYLPGEEAYLQLASLDEEGDTLCDSNLKLEVTDPRGRVIYPEIKKSGLCMGNNVINKPDYFSYYTVENTGTYKMKLINLDNGFEIEDSFEVRESVAFDIERIGPSRIYPLSDYEMVIKVKVNQDFKGKVTETVPMLFAVESINGLNTEQRPVPGNYTKTITWQVDWKKGNTYELKYKFDAPDISPYLYLLGPLKIGDFQEARKWQIASDDILELYVDAETETGAWDTFGSAPYLGVQDEPTNYISDNDRNNDSGTYSFDNAVQTVETINNVYLYIYAYGVTSSDFTSYINATNTGLGPPTSWNWVNVDVSGILTTWDAINAATVYFDRPNTQNEAGVDAAYLRVDYDPLATTVSGTCYNPDQIDPCADDQTVHVAVNGVLDLDDTGTTSGGGWSISVSPQLSQWDTVTVFIDGAAVASRAVAFAIEDSSNDISGMVLYEGHLTIGSADNIIASNSDLDDYDNSVSTDVDVFFDVDANNDLEVCDAAGSPGCEDFELFILEGNTYRPDSNNSGNVDTHDIEIDGTFSLDANIASVSGSWNDDGAFVEATSTVILTASQSAAAGAITEIVSASAGATNTDFYNLRLGDSAEAAQATWDLYLNLDVNNNLTIDAGTLDQNGSNNINLAGNLAIETNGSFTKGDTAVTFDGTGTKTWSDDASTKSNMGDVVINGTTLTIALGSDVKALTVNVAASQILDLGDSSYKLTLSDGGQVGVRPLQVSGDLDTGSDSEVEYIASQSVDIENIGYHDLTLSSASVTFYSYGNTIVSGSFNVEIGTFDGETDTWTLEGTGTPFTVQGTVIFDTSTFNYTGDGAGTTIASTSSADMGSYYDLQLGNDISLGSTNTYTADGDTTVTNVLTVGPGSGNNQTFAASSHTITLSGTGTPFVVNSSGILDEGTSTFSYTGNNATNVTAETYYILNIGSANDANVIFTASGNIVASNNVNLQSANAGYINTLDMGGNNLTVGNSDVSNSGGISVPTRSALTQTSSGTTKVFSNSGGGANIGGSGDTSFGNFTVGNLSDDQTYTITLAGEIGASGSVDITDGSAGTHTLDVSGSDYYIYVEGNWQNRSAFNEQQGTVIFTGSGNSNLDSGCITLGSCTNNDFYSVTINKDVGTEEVILTTYGLETSNTITVTRGHFVQGNTATGQSVRSEGTTAVTVQANGEWRNDLEGDLILGGNFVNNGSVSFDTNDNACAGGGTTDDISISSTVGATPRTWSGSGTFYMYNLTVQDQADSSVTCYSCDDVSGNTWTFSDCAGPANIIQAHYRWRDDDNSESLATWWRGTDEAYSGQDKQDNVRLRFSIKNDGGTATGNKAYTLQVADKGAYSTCESVPTGDFSDVPTTTGGCGSAVACMTTSGNFADGADTTAQLIPEGTFTTGDMVEDDSNSTGNIDIDANYYTEIEFNFQLTTNAGDNTAYCFRVVYDGSTDLDEYTKVAMITTSGATYQLIIKGSRLKGLRLR